MEALEISTGKLLAERKLTIACAESCTGGLLTSRLTDVAGSSAYVKGSIVSYSNEIKERLVGVKSATLAEYGAVSQQTAKEMAEGVRSAIETDIGVGVTGIAGPDGGTPQKPVGLVYIAVAGKHGTFIRENHFKGTRSEIKLQTTETALEMIKDYIATGGKQS